MMIAQWIKKRAARRTAATQLYQSVVTQSRDPVFYEAAHGYAVPDTMDGRFDLLCLHAALVIRALDRSGAEGRKVSQALFDRMFRSMDLDLREMGVGDLGVPRHMKKMMQAFNGRVHGYTAALDSDDAAALRDMVARNVYRMDGGAAAHEGTDAMTAYTKAAAQLLAAQGPEQFAQGRATFPKAIDFTRTETHHAQAV